MNSCLGVGMMPRPLAPWFWRESMGFVKALARPWQGLGNDQRLGSLSFFKFL